MARDAGSGGADPAMDSFGRRINYLRLSITDNCNLHCGYCMPRDARKSSCGGAPLDFEDLLRIARCATEIGIRKIRVTGGEPLVRQGVIGFLRHLSALPLLAELVLTTNGILLERMAPALRAAGVDRLNVSLDSLNAERFHKITRGGDLSKVLAGLQAAGEAGFPAPKINVVVMRGVNDREVLDFARLTIDQPYTVRFIEYMPTVGEQDWRQSFIPGDEILERVGAHYRLVEIGDDDRAGPARNFRIVGAQGGLGVVTAVSNHFCHSCNRIRVTSTGLAKGCLFGREASDLKPYLAAGGEENLRRVLLRIVGTKPQEHGPLSQSSDTKKVAMFQLGG